MDIYSHVALLLEDEPLISMDLELTLGNAGFDVSTVMSCSEAEEWLEICRPDVVIVDIMLQDGPATAVVSKLVEAEIPFIVHSGELESQHVGTPLERGLWLSKPAIAEELVGAAKTLVRKAG